MKNSEQSSEFREEIHIGYWILAKWIVGAELRERVAKVRKDDNQKARQPESQRKRRKI